MCTESNEGRISMSQGERDRSRVLHAVLDGQRTQVEAARLLRLTPRQVRRFYSACNQVAIRRLSMGCADSPPTAVSSDAPAAEESWRSTSAGFPDFGPTFPCEKLAEQGLWPSPETLRQWLLAEGLWQRQRQRDPHRQRRPRRSCFGELVQMDTSIHDWTEGRGEPMVLVNMIDDATSRVLSGFYTGETVEAFPL